MFTLTVVWSASFLFFFLTCHIFRVLFEMNCKQTCPLDDDGRPTCRTSMCVVVISHQRDINLIRWSTSFKKWAWQQRVRVMADLEERLRKIKEGETQGYLQRWAERERDTERERDSLLRGENWRERIESGIKTTERRQEAIVASASSKSFQRVIGVLSRPEMRHINFRQCPPESPGWLHHQIEIMDFVWKGQGQAEPQRKKEVTEGQGADAPSCRSSTEQTNVRWGRNLWHNAFHS